MPGIVRFNQEDADNFTDIFPVIIFKNVPKCIWKSTILLVAFPFSFFGANDPGASKWELVFFKTKETTKSVH